MRRGGEGRGGEGGGGGGGGHRSGIGVLSEFKTYWPLWKA